MRERRDPLDVFMSKVRVDQASGCWVWTGALLHSPKPGATYRVGGGYGIFQPAGEKTARAHRWIYKRLVGPIPPGLTLDHTCHTKDASCPGGEACPHRRCVNPAHLSPMSAKENNSLGGSPTAVNARKTHCIHGHEFTEANTRWYNNHTMRGCRECSRLWAESHRDPDRKRYKVKPPKR